MTNDNNDTRSWWDRLTSSSAVNEVQEAIEKVVPSTPSGPEGSPGISSNWFMFGSNTPSTASNNESKEMENPWLAASSSLSFGAVAGYCSGLALKKLGKTAAYSFGSLLIIGQVAAHNGYIQMNWKKIENDIMTAMDLNKDGKVDGKDSQLALTQATKYLTANSTANMTGFSAGLLYGLRSG